MFKEVREWIAEMLGGRLFQFKKMRLLLAWIGGIFLFLNSRISNEGFRMGIPFVVIGESIRIWALGFVEEKGKKLATSGPFAHVRNPLYLGNFLLGLGFVLVSRSSLNLILFLVGFAILYTGTIRKEENELLEKFGDAYFRYMKEVPKFLPRLTPYRERVRARFEWEFLVNGREHEAFFGIVLLLSGLYVWKEMLHLKKLHLKQEVAIGLVFVAIGFLIYDRFKGVIQKIPRRS